MKALFRSTSRYLQQLSTRFSPALWQQTMPVRAELFSVERLEQHARSLANAQQLQSASRWQIPLIANLVNPLQQRLNANAKVLLAAYRKSAAELAAGHSIVPAAEWLLDNYHLVEQHVREIRSDLPAGYYRQLPKLAHGPFQGYPRVFGLAWAYVAHTDSHFDPLILNRFLRAYQQVQPLSIGELWAVAITLRIVLLENLRRLTDQISIGLQERAAADQLADQLLQPASLDNALRSGLSQWNHAVLSDNFAAQLVKRLRDQDPFVTPALQWLEQRLTLQSTHADEVVLAVLQRQGASNVSVRNVMTSLRSIAAIDWAELFESVSLVDQCLSAGSNFAAMDFSSRNLYRSAIEQLARGASCSELVVAAKALDNASTATRRIKQPIQAAREGDPGYSLIGAGRIAFEQQLGFKGSFLLRLGRIFHRSGIQGYISLFCLFTAGLLLLAGWLLSTTTPGSMLLLLLLGIIPASELANALLQRLINGLSHPVPLPALALRHGVPVAYRTLVVVPTLLTDKTALLQQISQLEVHFLAGGSGELYFALLSDFADAKTQELSTDHPLLALACTGIQQLNTRYSKAVETPRFMLLHRPRQFNPQQQIWMGWERKRGKLMQLNALLQGSGQQYFLTASADLPLLSRQVPAGVRYVITLDADTQLPRDAALRLVGKIAHPLNQAQFDPQTQRVIAGYGILQPRVTPMLAAAHLGSRYQRLTSGPAGLDPYAAAISEIYQDLFLEGSFTGKGIYDVAAFSAALSGQVPDNTLLSHDLFEGSLARAALVSDIEVVEDFPARYDVAMQRQHRWTRGDWQLLPWLLPGKKPGHHAKNLPSKLPTLGRWKMCDNLRRTLLAPTCILALFAAMALPGAGALTAVLLVLGSLLLPILLPHSLKLWPRQRWSLAEIKQWHRPLQQCYSALVQRCSQSLLPLVFLADQAWQMSHAIVTALWRTFFSHRHMLQWVTAAQAGNAKSLTLSGFYWRMAPAISVLLPSTALILWFAPEQAPLLLPLVLLWCLAPAIAYWLSRPTALHPVAPLSLTEAASLRLIARRTWRYFEQFVSSDSHMLPPDNVQFEPTTTVAHRTSPTNIGVYLLSTVVARDFGWAGTYAAVLRLEACMATLQQLRLYRGHLYNWYDTQTLAPLEPVYVSSVDSGNLAGHLIALANACEEWQQTPISQHALQGIQDNLALAKLNLPLHADMSPLAAILATLALQLAATSRLAQLTPSLSKLAANALQLSKDICPATKATESQQSLVFYLQAVVTSIADQQVDQLASLKQQQQLQQRLAKLALQARAMAMAMDFKFLLNAERNLLSIGFNLSDNQLDHSCYDLLASEARLASLFAIAKGDLSSKHWFRLGRSTTPVADGVALLSWSGSMFEYLMPALVMSAPANSLLEQSNRLIVMQQMRYGRQLQVPWGISESAFNARDLALNYQYSNFGIPGLGLKRGLAQNVVIAPYATALAAMVDAPAAYKNFIKLQQLGMLGSYGFYEALDYTRTRRPEQSGPVLIASVMAHHQGMTLIALANTLQQGLMRSRFHREPMIQACALLLQERPPAATVHVMPQAEELSTANNTIKNEPLTERHLDPTAKGPPQSHILSNGRYSVMLTATGGGYSNWCGLAISRWREDSSCDPWGSYILLRDRVSGARWSPTLQPLDLDKNTAAKQQFSAVFSEDHAEFCCKQAELTTKLDILVSAEHDGEVRRVTLSNHSQVNRDIDLTSYTEIVLQLASSDNAHPAFSKLFVQTEYLPNYNALIATRRLRTADENPIWLAHFAVIEGEHCADAAANDAAQAGPQQPRSEKTQYETDRARFFGSAVSLYDAEAISSSKALSNSSGTVLDPIIALRQSVRLAAGKRVRVAFWTLVAHSKAELLLSIEQHNERSAYGRAAMLAWTQAQVQLRHLAVTVAEAADFQRLTGPLLYNDNRFRAPAAAIFRGAAAQAELWQHSISGDLPIVLLHIDDIEEIATVQQLLRAHEYWRMKQLAVDLVIINERATSYMQQLQSAIEASLRRSQSRPGLNQPLAAGAVYILRADLMSVASRAQLAAVARVVLYARRGNLNKQLTRLATPALPLPWQAGQRQPIIVPRAGTAEHKTEPHSGATLEYFNGMGGFASDGREYITLLQQQQRTPMPWLNVIANPRFGFQVSASGSGYSWAANSRENQLTPWSNDPVLDPSSEVIYVKDDEHGTLFCATAQPRNDGGHYQACHGFGYSRFHHQAHGIELSLLQYVPLEDPIKISRLSVQNHSGKVRHLTLTAYAEWVLGRERGACAPFLLSTLDTEHEVLLVRNPWQSAFAKPVAFAALAAPLSGWTADRSEFIGRNRSLASPAALLHATPLTASSGAGLDPCAALQQQVTLAPGERIELVFFLGQSSDTASALALVTQYRQTDLSALLQQVQAHWHTKLGAVQVTTPDRAMDIMLNGWLLYQTIVCRLYARAAFYQASGAYGFRDQLQDGMALTFAAPELARQHLLRAAERQFIEGDVQHWWLPHSGQGVRSRISDDRVWLAFVCAHYIASSGDKAILAEQVSFLQGPPLDASQHDAFFQPMPTDCTASLFEHCARGLDLAISLSGTLGLPLIGSGDWNDGMDQVGAAGKGESVWLGWLLLQTLTQFIPLAADYDHARASQWQAHSLQLRKALEQHGWDGNWYKRATYDDGSWLGSAQSEECQIDSIAQSWAVLTGAANPQRTATAMAAVTEHLWRPAEQLLLLFTPPFEHSVNNPGYIKGYPPGLRENGGQYSHAAMWVVLALAKLGEADQAQQLFSMLNPINHALTPAGMHRYKVEPYVMAADIYSVAPHIGRGGWSWYTGAAGWMYQAGLGAILGISRQQGQLQLAPQLPKSWPGFSATVQLAGTHYHLRIRQSPPNTASPGLLLDEQLIAADSPRFLSRRCIRLPLDQQTHSVDWQLDSQD
ncbi:glycosyl transferase [Alishewanella longhuensis]|uniref:Glycosyl transferase n=1 Tax=Alishewanella longhuensis TaxID=1091037 RepID=A0ABQ3KU08_9ALTE|nr:glucoamylase family protein [Alishewanella longhuensis]GHG59946.1 glycosyl transferase [Alishewanella longhuensis]